MTLIPAVENPTGRTGRRRKLSRKQIAAGFGGKRRMRGRRSTRRRSTKRRTYRRNPGLATLAANPRRHRRRNSPRYYVRHRVYRKRRNPGMKMFGIDVGAAVWVATGAITVRALPTTIKKFWPGMPTTGAMGLAARFGTVLALGFVGNMVPMLRRGGRVDKLVTGGMVALLIDVWNQWAAPALGLPIGGYVTDAELQAMGLRGYIPTPKGLKGYIETPTGLRAQNLPQQGAGSAYPTPLLAQ